MRRWNLLYVAAPLAAVLITLSGPGSAIAAGAPNEDNFKGKAAVYSPGSDSYFVVSFTCSARQLSGKWTFENVGSGTLASHDCSLTNGDPGINLDIPDVGLVCVSPNSCGTLSMKLSNITTTKTYVPTLDTVYPCPATPDGQSGPCIEMVAVVNGVEFDSTHAFTPPSYGTLTIQLPKTP